MAWHAIRFVALARGRNWVRKEARDGCNGRGRGLVLRGPWEVRRDSLVGEGVCVCDGRDVRAMGEVEGLCHEAAHER